MSLIKRHIGRRVTVVGIGVALLMLGLEAPAFAIAPTIASFTPSSGPAGCVIVITGTNFDNPNVTAVTIGADAVADFAIISGTEIWATSDAVASGTLHVTNGSGTANSTTDFVVPASGPGGCAPTVTSFDPTCGSAGTTVKLTGTNLLSGSDPVADPTEVRFVNAVTGTYDDNAVHTIPNAETPTTLSVLVPSGQTDGPIRVTTGVDADFSPTLFAVPPPDCPTVGAKHARSITLSLRRKLIARGKVSVADDTAECIAGVPVKIQRRRAGGGWRTVGSTTTTDTGAYKKRIKNRHGKYRSLAPKVTLDDASVCSRAVSAVRKH